MSGDGLRVLVVDDDPVLRLMTTHMLKSVGPVVSSAESVAQASRQMAEADFDVVVCDYLMPGETGLALAEVCAERSIGFILLTGRTEDDYIDDPRFPLVGTHLTKPVSTDDLVNAVRARAGTTGSST